MKKIFIVLVILLSVLLIYLGFKDKKIYYLSLGDSLANGVNEYGIKDYGYSDYIKEYLENKDLLEVYVNSTVNNNKTTIDIMNDIVDNVNVSVGNKEKTFQNTLIKADLITISLGLNELLKDLELNNDFNTNDLYTKFEQLIKDYDKLFKLLRSYSKEDIMFIGIYNPTNNQELDDFFKYANSKLSNLCIKYEINYINIYEDFKDKNFIFLGESLYPNKKGYKLISNKIIELLEKK